MARPEKGRSPERPPSPCAPRAARRSHRIRAAALGAAVVTTAVVTAFGPAAADGLAGSEPSPLTAEVIAAVQVPTEYPAVDPTLAHAADGQEARERLAAALADNERREADARVFVYFATLEQARAESARQQAEAAAQAERARAEEAPAPRSGGGSWDALARCESGGNWGAATGNGYYGGLQFSPSTWRAYGGSGMPHQSSREAQIAVAERVRAGQGWGAWPSCSSKLGLR
ncbi:MAG TPA: transglycosylase family protein [Acidimicrobiales bacterium]|nr:transglycosylase family protein [Acidimicrobiales bacterium]